MSSRKSITGRSSEYISTATIIQDTITPNDSSTDIGSSSNKFRNGYFSGALSSASATITTLNSTNATISTLTATSIQVTGTINAARLNQSDTRVNIGYLTGATSQSDNSIAIGNSAGNSSQSASSVAIGYKSGYSSQGTQAVAIGDSAGQSSQGQYTVALGFGAGNNNQAYGSVAIGVYAGYNRQAYANTDAIAIGTLAGYTGQGGNSICIGRYAGHTGFGEYSIGIGSSVDSNGYTGVMMLNASSSGYTANVSNACYINPVRNVVPSVPSATVGTPTVMMYNTMTKEVSYATGVLDCAKFIMNANHGYTNAGVHTAVRAGVTTLVAPNGSCIGGITGGASQTVSFQNVSTVTRNFLISMKILVSNNVAANQLEAWMNVGASSNPADSQNGTGATGFICYGRVFNPVAANTYMIANTSVAVVPAGQYVSQYFLTSANSTVIYGGTNELTSTWFVQAL